MNENLIEQSLQDAILENQLLLIASEDEVREIWELAWRAAKKSNSETREQLKIAIEALQWLIASIEGYRKNTNDNQPCDAEVFAKQALEKIGES